MRKHPYLICYDIRDSKRLQKVHKLACKYASPVQYSVFYAEMTEQTIESLITEMESRIDDRVDDVRIYGVEGLSKAVMIGETPAEHFLMKKHHI